MRVPFAIVLALALSGCASLRDVRLDHQLPPSEMPALDLSVYQSAQKRLGGQDPDLAVAAAISGGGHRAANFALGVLLALEQFPVEGRTVDLLREIDYFSTVSGGGFAAGTYVSSLYDHLQSTGGKPEGYSLAEALAENRQLLVNLERGYHATRLESWFCLRCLGHRDAGDILERKLDRHVLGSASRPDGYSLRLIDLFRARGDAAPVLLPYWAANATAYENGARVPFTPDVLAGYHVTGYTHNMKPGECRTSTFAIPLSVGVKASASFPVAFPATTLSCNHPDDRLNRFLHLMDGGLADNSGCRTAVEFLKQYKAGRKVLLIIYDDARAVPTSLNITRAQQQLLLKAGGAVVGQHRDLLRQYLVQE